MNAFVECGSSLYLTDHTNKEKKDARQTEFLIHVKGLFIFWPKKNVKISKIRKKTRRLFPRWIPASKRVRRISNMIRANSIWIPWILNYILRGFFLAARHEIFSVRNDESKHVLVNNVLLWFIRFDIYTLLNYASTSDNAWKVRYDLNAIIVG